MQSAYETTKRNEVDEQKQKIWPRAHLHFNSNNNKYKTEAGRFCWLRTSIFNLFSTFITMILSEIINDIYVETQIAFNSINCLSQNYLFQLFSHNYWQLFTEPIRMHTRIGWIFFPLLKPFGRFGFWHACEWAMVAPLVIGDESD